jgi:hypothetical protein
MMITGTFDIKVFVNDIWLDTDDAMKPSSASSGGEQGSN